MHCLKAEGPEVDQRNYSRLFDEFKFSRLKSKSKQIWAKRWILAVSYKDQGDQGIKVIHY